MNPFTLAHDSVRCKKRALKVVNYIRLDAMPYCPKHDGQGNSLRSPAQSPAHVAPSMKQEYSFLYMPPMRTNGDCIVDRSPRMRRGSAMHYCVTALRAGYHRSCHHHIVKEDIETPGSPCSLFV